MPVYEYHCKDHGYFEALRPMSEFKQPCECPECSAPADRVMLTAPMLANANRAQMKAHAVNEKSADSPKRTSTHGPGCSCCSGGKKKSGKTRVMADGSKSFPSKRPWMISH